MASSHSSTLAPHGDTPLHHASLPPDLSDNLVRILRTLATYYIIYNNTTIESPQNMAYRSVVACKHMVLQCGCDIKVRSMLVTAAKSSFIKRCDSHGLMYPTSPTIQG